MNKVLFIEDDMLVSKMYKQVFEHENFEVYTAKDGREGVQKAESIIPEIIFCDVVMPKMNGFEVLESLKENDKTKNILVIMLTSLPKEENSQRAIDAGARGYIVKGEYKPEEIVNLAKELVSK